MTPERLVRLAELQAMASMGEFARDEQAELDNLRRELAASPEVADNPATLFVDESRRPNLDGTDYNDTLHRMCFEELEAIAAKVGRVAFRVLVDRVMGG